MWRPHFRNTGTLAGSPANAEQSCTAHPIYSSTPHDVVAFADRQFVSLFVGVVVFAISVALVGCSAIVVVSPSHNQQNVPSPVPACVAWNDSGFTSLRFIVDGVDKTSSFAINNGATPTCSLPSSYSGTTAGTATASLQLNAGNHSLVAAGDYYFAGTIHTSDTSNFSVVTPSFSLAPSPNPLQLAPGAQGTLTVNVTSGGGFNGTISATLTGLPFGVTPSPGTLTIPAGSTSGQFTITASATASPGSSTVTVNGTSGALTSNSTFTLSIVPSPLHFSPAGPLAINAGGSSSVKVTMMPAPTNASTVNLTTSSGSISAPASTTIAAGQTSSPSFPLNGVIGGSATVTAASSGFQSATLTINVQPVITSLSPTSGPRGTTVTITGKGFTNGSTVSFGSQSPTVTFVSSSQLNITVPNTLSLPPGSTLVQVATNGQKSNTLNFNVLPIEVLTAVPGKLVINFAVMDFTHPSTPSMVKVNPPYAGQSVVTCNGSMIAVGNMNGPQVVLYDISNPALPVQVGQPVATPLANISAIKWNGSKILAGESSGTGQQVVLIDVSNPTSPTVGAPVNACATIGNSTQCITGIGSIGLSGSKAVVAGTNSQNIDIMDFTNPTQPTQKLFNPNLGTGLKAALDSTLAAVGPLSLGNAFTTVALVDITQPAVVSQSTIDILGVTSISIKGSRVVAGSVNYTHVDLIDFTNRSNPNKVPYDPGLGGGWYVTLTSSRLALGNTNPTNLLPNVVLADPSVAPPLIVGSQNPAFSPVSQVCISDF